MPIVKFVKEKKEIEVPEGANLRAEAVKAGVNLNQGLNGIGAAINKYANCNTMSLGLIGGFSTPLLLSTGGEHSLTLFSYITILNNWIIPGQCKNNI